MLKKTSLYVGFSVISLTIFAVANAPKHEIITEDVVAKNLMMELLDNRIPLRESYYFNGLTYSSEFDFLNNTTNTNERPYNQDKTVLLNIINKNLLKQDKDVKDVNSSSLKILGFVDYSINDEYNYLSCLSFKGDFIKDDVYKKQTYVSVDGQLGVVCEHENVSKTRFKLFY